MNKSKNRTKVGCIKRVEWLKMNVIVILLLQMNLSSLFRCTFKVEKYSIKVI